MAEPIIICEHLHVGYGGVDVLHDVSLEIKPGAFLPFIGPNGAGKTTLLRAILGLVKPRKGRIITPASRRLLGYVPQQKVIDPLYPVSIRQIALMGLYPELGWWRRPKPEQKKRVRNTLDRFGLADHVHKTFGELSGGMKQKALIVRAFVTGADVLVMDEPTSELDEGSEREVLSHLFGLVREEGKTVLIAHHGLKIVDKLASKVCLVNQGRVRIAGIEEIER